jgi:hypothetical protein
MAPSSKSDNVPPFTALTPAGRVPADKVRHVKPGQKVVRNADGSHSVEDGPDLPPDERKGEPHDKSGTDSGGI